MAFMTLKTMKKKNISTLQFCSPYCLFDTWSRQLKVKDGIFFCQGKVSKGIGVTKSNVFKGLVMTLLASTRVFHKKK